MSYDVFEVGEVVLCRQTGEPWWPAVVCAPSKPPGSSEDFPGEALIAVKWIFSDADYDLGAWIPESRITKWRECGEYFSKSMGKLHSFLKSPRKGAIERAKAIRSQETGLPEHMQRLVDGGDSFESHKRGVSFVIMDALGYQTKSSAVHRNLDPLKSVRLAESDEGNSKVKQGSGKVASDKSSFGAILQATKNAATSTTASTRVPRAPRVPRTPPKGDVSPLSRPRMVTRRRVPMSGATESAGVYSTKRMVSQLRGPLLRSVSGFESEEAEDRTLERLREPRPDRFEDLSGCNSELIMPISLEPMEQEVTRDVVHHAVAGVSTLICVSRSPHGIASSEDLGMNSVVLSDQSYGSQPLPESAQMLGRMLGIRGDLPDPAVVSYALARQYLREEILRERELEAERLPPMPTLPEAALIADRETPSECAAISESPSVEKGTGKDQLVSADVSDASVPTSASGSRRRRKPSSTHSEDCAPEESTSSARKRRRVEGSMGGVCEAAGKALLALVDKEPVLLEGVPAGSPGNASRSSTASGSMDTDNGSRVSGDDDNFLVSPPWATFDGGEAPNGGSARCGAVNVAT